jgi:hypothetical protein
MDSPTGEGGESGDDVDSPTGGGKGEEGENNMDSPTLNDSRQKFRSDKMQGHRQTAGTNMTHLLFNI